MASGSLGSGSTLITPGVNFTQHPWLSDETTHLGGFQVLLLPVSETTDASSHAATSITIVTVDCILLTKTFTGYKKWASLKPSWGINRLAQNKPG